MTAGQPVLRTEITMNVEPAKAIHAFELLEPIKRHFARAGHKLQQLGFFLLVEAADCAPEPLHLRREGRVVVVLGVVLPVVHVNVRQTRDEQFQFLLVEDGDQTGWDNLAEAYVTLAVIHHQHKM